LKMPAQRFGQTRSGKAICTHLTDNPTTVEHFKDFNSEDDFDAYALFQYLLIRELRRTNNCGAHRRYVTWALFHDNRLGDPEKAAQMSTLSLVTSIDIVKHGKSRADHFFRD